MICAVLENFQSLKVQLAFLIYGFTLSHSAHCFVICYPVLGTKTAMKANSSLKRGLYKQGVSVSVFSDYLLFLFLSFMRTVYLIIIY